MHGALEQTQLNNRSATMGCRRRWTSGRLLGTDAPYTDGGRWTVGPLLASVAIDFVDLGLTSMWQVPSHTTYPRDSNAGDAAGCAARYPSTDLMDACWPWKDLGTESGQEQDHFFCGGNRF